MVKALYFSAGQAIYEVSQNKGHWELVKKTTPHSFRCLTVDRTRDGRLYGGSI